MSFCVIQFRFSRVLFGMPIPQKFRPCVFFTCAIKKQNKTNKQTWGWILAGMARHPDVFARSSRLKNLSLNFIAKGYLSKCTFYNQLYNFLHFWPSVTCDNYVTCLKSTIKNCTKGKLDDSTFDAILRQMGVSETTMCTSGSLEVPTIPPALVSSIPCSSSFAVDANNCLKTFHQKFAANKSDLLFACEFSSVQNS